MKMLKVGLPSNSYFPLFFSPDEIEKRERQRRQRKLNRQLEKKQAKLAAKGIHIDIGKEKML